MPPLDPTSLLGEQPPDNGLQPFKAGADPDIQDPLAHWDAVVQDLDEPPVPVALPWPTRRASSRRTRSAGPLVEGQTLYLPSNRNVSPRDDDVELGLRKQQAKAQLHQLRELISDKSFLYSDVIRKAPRKGVRTRIRGTIKGINTQISLHCNFLFLHRFRRNPLESRNSDGIHRNCPEFRKSTGIHCRVG